MLGILHLCILFVFIRSVCIFYSGSLLYVMVFYLLGQLYTDRPFNIEAIMSMLQSLWIVAATALIQLEMDEEPHSVDSFLQGVVTDSKVMTVWTKCGYRLCHIVTWQALVLSLVCQVPLGMRVQICLQNLILICLLLMVPQ